MLRSNEQVNHEINEEIQRYLETNEDVNTIILNPWNTAKAGVRGKFTATQAYCKKREKSQVNNQT